MPARAFTANARPRQLSTSTDKECFMNRMRIVTAMLAGICASGAYAQGSSVSHLGVLQADYSRAKQGNVSEIDTTLLFATIFLQEVNHGDLPHSQAFFLERAASLSMAYADLDVDLGFADTSGDFGAFDAQYITESHWVIGGGYTRFDIDRLSEVESHNVEFGRYLDDSSRLLFTYAKADTESPFLPDSRTQTYGLEYKNVTLHPSMTTALTLDMKYNHVDADTTSGNLYGLQGEYHFSLATSLLAGAEVTRGADAGEKYNLGLMQYLTRFFAVGTEFTRTNPDLGRHTSTWAVRARLLF
jgi:hypothetical protein